MLESPTAIASTIAKRCENPACGRTFHTHEPFRLYCTLKCRDYAARRRRRLKEKMEHEGHDPRMGTTQRELEEAHRTAAMAIKNKEPEAMKNVEDATIKFLFDAVVNKGMSHLLNDNTIPLNARQAVNKMLVERDAAIAAGEQPATPDGSYIVSETETTLRDLGLLNKDASPTEYVADVEPTDEEKARDL